MDWLCLFCSSLSSTISGSLFTLARQSCALYEANQVTSSGMGSAGSSFKLLAVFANDSVLV